MPQTSFLENRIFQISNNNEFNDLAINIFQYQVKKNPVYRSFVQQLGRTTNKISDFHDIPFLPVEFFKSNKVISGEFRPELTFYSSGTTGQIQSCHYIKNRNIYFESLTKSFQIFFGDPADYVILALLPSYIERDGSSLVHMVKTLIEQNSQAESGFYLNDYSALYDLLKNLKKSDKKVILFGVTFALLDMAERFPVEFPELVIIETGGMKGRRKEIVREELHRIIKAAFGVKKVYSEYGMTELLSQAYSTGKGLFTCPPWMKVLIRDTNDPLNLITSGKTGGVNVIDLANIHSCSFIATQDLGKIHKDGRFEVLGRFDNSEVRGCNLMVD